MNCNNNIYCNLCNCEWTLEKINATYFDKQTSILILCSDTVKEPSVSSHIRVSKQTILLHMLPYMFVKQQLPFIPCYIFRLLALMIFVITLVQSFKPPGSNNINNTHNINGHIIQKLAPKFHMKYSSMEPVLFEKLHNIKLTCSIFRVTTCFQFDSTKNTLNTLLAYAQELDANLKTYSELVSNNIHDQKSYDVNQWNLSYSVLLASCSDKSVDCKLQIIKLSIQLNNIFTTSNHSKHNHTK